ncbi:MAG: CBS domain-containing protein [Candidatus Celaenobacter antarcticus]|nr:CBS domain-containing protein [Candidatus Celaenobacter antarcticus]
MLKLLKAKDIMMKEVITIGPDILLKKAIKKLLENEISSMPVVDDTGEMVGIISCVDILNLAFDGYLSNTKVEMVMTKNVVYFKPDTNVEEIAFAISKNHFHRIPIVKDGRIVGIVSRRDIIKSVLSFI